MTLSSPGLTGRSSNHRPGILDRPVKPGNDTVEIGQTHQKCFYVPTRSGALSLRSAAMTESAVIRPVLGFSDGMFSIENENRAESESTSMEWQFRVTAGSAHISIVVRSGPMPASDSAAATLTFSGKPAAASRAVPAKTHLATLSPSTEIPFLTR